MTEVTVANFKPRPHLTKEQRLPQYIKDAEKVIRTVKSCQNNFKTVMANSRYRGQHFKKVYSLTLNVLKYYDYIQTIIEKIELLQKEPMLRKEVASILIYEILFGNGNLTGESKPVLTILKYRNSIMHTHEELEHSGDIKINELNIPHYARVNTLVTTVPYVIKDLKCEGYQQIFYNDDISEDEYLQLVKNLNKKTFLVDLHFKDLLVFAYNENLVQLQLYSKGHIFLQDKSSYIPVHALNPEPGSAVLDACAAPGMKSVHLAARMQNKGLLMACERNAERFETLKEMLQYGAVKISKIFCKDFTLIDPHDQAYSSIDYILLDPSCSGSGMVNRMDQVTNTAESKNKERLEKLAGFQIILLKHALKFPSVKRVVYSTCSVNKEENEYVVHEVLNAFINSFKLVSVFPEWPERGSKDYEFGELCLRTTPEKHLTNGFFVAMFERLDYTEQYKTYDVSQKERKKGKSNRNGYFYEKSAENFCEDVKSYVTSDNNFNNKKLSCSESLGETKTQKGTEVSISSDIFNVIEQNNSSTLKVKKSKERNSKLSELDETEDTIDMSGNTPVSHKKRKHSKFDSSGNYSIPVEKQDMVFQCQKDNVFCEEGPVKAKKHKKHKHKMQFDTDSTEDLKVQNRGMVLEKASCSPQKYDSLESTKSKDKKYFYLYDVNETAEKHFQPYDTIKNKEKHFQACNAVKKESNFHFSNSSEEIKNKLCTDVIIDKSMFQGAVSENSSTQQCEIQQSVLTLNETVNSVEGSSKRHKKSKKHKKHSGDKSNICSTEGVIIECISEKNISSVEDCPSKHKKSKQHKKLSEEKKDICNSEDVKIEYISDNNTGFLEDCPSKHKKSKKHKNYSSDNINDIHDGENTVVEIKKKHKKSFVDLITYECSNENHVAEANKELLITSQIEKHPSKCAKSDSQVFPLESSDSHDHFGNDHTKYKKSKKHKRHMQSSFSESQEIENILLDNKTEASSCSVLSLSVESISRISENMLGSESEKKHSSKKNKHKKCSKDYSFSFQDHKNLSSTTNKNLSDVCDTNKSTPCIYITESADTACANQTIFDLEKETKHKHKKCKKSSKES